MRPVIGRRGVGQAPRGTMRVRPGVALAGTLILTLIIALAAPAQAQDAADGPGGSAPVEVRNQTLVVRAQSPDRLDPPLVVDRLSPRTLLEVRATGFDADVTGRVVQCADGSGCENGISVRFDDGGSARFQYLVSEEVGGPGLCRLGAPPCTIEILVGDAQAVVHTVFVDESPPAGTLVVDPDEGVRVGDTVAVALSDLEPGADATVTVCAVPAAAGTRCGAPGPEIPVVADGDGSATVEVAVPVAVGTDRVACGRRSACQVVVQSDDAGVWAPPATLGFAAGPKADYDAGRVAAGVTIALALVALAGWLILTTDWRPPPESDSSAIDDADYADLDLEADQFEERAAT